jgi:hypothetical protein
VKVTEFLSGIVARENPRPRSKAAVLADWA